MSPRIPLLLVLPLAAAAILAGCGAADAIDPRKAELALRYDVEEATGEEVGTVECPADIPVSVGTRFTCRVEASSGEVAVAELEITSDSGDLRVLSLEAP